MSAIITTQASSSAADLMNRRRGRSAGRRNREMNKIVATYSSRDKTIYFTSSSIGKNWDKPSSAGVVNTINSINSINNNHKRRMNQFRVKSEGNSISISISISISFARSLVRSFHRTDRQTDMSVMMNLLLFISPVLFING